jgi:microcystin-dependent protein
MAKPPRKTQFQFGLNGDQSHFGQFGSRVAVPPGVNTKVPASIQALSAFLNNGWLDAINGANKAPFLEDMNGLFYLLFYQISYGFQEGIPEWDAGTTYYQFSIVKKAGTFELYGSLIDNNANNALPNQADNGSWHFLNPPSVAPGIMADFGGGPAAPFGWLLCDGSVYAQATWPALFAAVGANWNTGGEGGGNFRVPDIRGRTSIGAGSGAGLTPRTLAGLLGEERHILTASETGQVPHTHDITHEHDLPVGIQGAQVFFPANNVFNPSPNSWPYERTRTDLAWWVQGVAGIGAATSISWFKTAPNDTANSGGANYTGGGVDGASHNNMQPSAVVTKVIKT